MEIMRTNVPGDASGRDTRFDYKALKNAALVLRAVTNKERQKIIELLVENGPMNVTQIHRKLGMQQAVASLHLGVLRRAHIVNDDRDGRIVCYSINLNRLLEIQRIATHIADTKIG
jgi:DNA-binding transcriptional ArsR family regulator